MAIYTKEWLEQAPSWIGLNSHRVDGLPDEDLVTLLFEQGEKFQVVRKFTRPQMIITILKRMYINELIENHRKFLTEIPTCQFVSHELANRIYG